MKVKVNVRLTQAQAAALARIVWRCHTWGQLEAAAGVTDRQAFWRHRSEDVARLELHRLIAERVKAGELEG